MMGKEFLGVFTAGCSTGDWPGETAISHSEQCAKGVVMIFAPEVSYGRGNGTQTNGFTPLTLGRSGG
jgi:hypothetical protein